MRSLDCLVHFSGHLRVIVLSTFVDTFARSLGWLVHFSGRFVRSLDCLVHFSGRFVRSLGWLVHFSGRLRVMVLSTLVDTCICSLIMFCLLF